MTEATTLGGTLVNQAIAAPITSVPPASSPQSPASAQTGIDSSFPRTPADPATPPRRRSVRVGARGRSGGKILAPGLLTLHEEHRLPVLRSLVAIAALADPVRIR